MPLKHKCVSLPVVSDHLIHFQLPDLPCKLRDKVCFFMFLLLAFIKCLLGQTRFLDASFLISSNSPLAWAHLSEWPPGTGDPATHRSSGVVSMLSGKVFRPLFQLASKGRQRALMWLHLLNLLLLGLLI